MTKYFVAFLVLATIAAACIAVFFLHVPYNELVRPLALLPVATSTPVKESLPKIKVLLVPGHDLLDVGTSHKGLTEESLNRKLAGMIAEYVESDERFDVILSRHPDTGEYSQVFATYFKDEAKAIEQFKLDAKKDMKAKLRSGEVVKDVTIIHNNTSVRTGNILYGFNKFANESNVGLALHIHFNNYERSRMTTAGKYSGYSIYVPEDQYGNATSSMHIAQSIEARLATILTPSDLPLEKDTIIESQELIAIGANNSRTGPSVLIEYGYIYEPKLLDDDHLREIAKLTYEGIAESFFPGSQVKGTSYNVAAVELLKNSIPKRVNPKVSATAYVAANLDTGEVLLQSKKDTVLPIASVSKLMTALIATKYMDPNKITTITRSAVETEGTFGELYIGEKIKVSTLLYPLLMESSNDAAAALAESYGREKFIALMNKEAKKIGTAKTHFDEPTGLSERNVSTPEELVKIARYIQDNYPEIFKKTDIATYKSNGHLWKNPTHFLGMKTYIGGKNGFTNAAGNTSVSLFSIRGQTKTTTIAIALLNTKNREKDVLSIIQNLDLERGVVQ